MFISSALLVLASLLSMHSVQEVDDAKHLIYAYQDAGHYDSAHLVVDAAIQFSEQNDYDYGLAKSLFIKSYLHICQNNAGESFLLNLRALKILNESTDERTPKTKVSLYINTSEILQDHFKYDEARKYYELALDIALKEGFEDKAAKIYYSLGQVERKKGNLSKARTYIENSLALGKEINNEWTILNSYNLLGLIAYDLKAYEDARRYFVQMRDFEFSEEEPSAYKGLAWLNIGETYLSEENIPQALASLETSLVQYQELGDAVNAFNVQLTLTGLYYQNEQYTAAIKVGEAALSSYQYTTKSPEWYKIYDLLANTSFELEEFQEARTYYNQFVFENEEFLHSQQNLIELSERYKMEMLTSSFFKDLEKQEQMAQMNQIIYLLLALGLFAGVILQARKYFFKRGLEKALREVTENKKLGL